MIKAQEGEMASSIFLQINKSRSENAGCVRLWIKGVCWTNVGSEHDVRTVCFILLARQHQKICRRKLLSAMIHIPFYPERLLLSGNGSSDELFKIMGSQKILTLPTAYSISYKLWEHFAGSSSPRVPALHFCRMKLPWASWWWQP